MRTCVVLGLSVSALLVGCSHPEAAVNTPPPGQAWLTPGQVQQSKVQTQRLSNTEVGASVVATGRITYDDLHVTHVFSPVSGRVTAISAELGQHVKKGQALASIASPDVGVASSDLDKARADLNAAQLDATRQRGLCNAKAASERDAETAEGAFARAKAEFTRAEEKTRLLRGIKRDGEAVTQDYVLRAPIDGEVVARAVNPGTEIQGQYAGASNELFTVGQLDHVWVLADIFETDVSRVVPGQRVVIHVPAYPNMTFDGTVDWVSSVLDPATRTATVRCVINNPEARLKPEMFATVTIASTGTPMLTVSRDSVVRLGDKTVVFVQAGQSTDGTVHFERRPVIVDEALEDEVRIPVLHGLEQGESVVTSGAQTLAEMI